jgi:NAD(P)-dependent dehydrogenase (short-subunit alcohol dehydrogenase family)
MSFNPIALNRKRFLISGAASGLGRATAVLLSKLGAELVLLDINDEGLNSTKELCGDTLVHCITANLQNPLEIKPVIIRVVIKASVEKKAYSCFIDTFATFKVFL